MSENKIVINKALLSAFRESEFYDEIDFIEIKPDRWISRNKKKILCNHTLSKYEILDWVHRSFIKKADKNRFTHKNICVKCYKQLKIKGFDKEAFTDFFSKPLLEKIEKGELSSTEVVSLRREGEPYERGKTDFRYIPDLTFDEFLEYFRRVRKERESNTESMISLDIGPTEENKLSFLSEEQMQLVNILPKHVQLEMMRSIKIYKSVVDITEGVAIWLYLLLKIYNNEETAKLKNVLLSEVKGYYTFEQLERFLKWEAKVFGMYCSMRQSKEIYEDSQSDIFAYVKRKKGNCLAQGILLYYLVKQVFGFKNLYYFAYTNHINIGIIAKIDTGKKDFQLTMVNAGKYKDLSGGFIKSTDRATPLIRIENMNAHSLLKELSVLLFETTWEEMTQKHFVAYSLFRKRLGKPSQLGRLECISQDPSIMIWDNIGFSMWELNSIQYNRIKTNNKIVLPKDLPIILQRVFMEMNKFFESLYTPKSSMEYLGDTGFIHLYYHMIIKHDREYLKEFFSSLHTILFQFKQFTLAQLLATRWYFTDFASVIESFFCDDNHFYWRNFNNTQFDYSSETEFLSNLGRELYRICIDFSTKYSALRSRWNESSYAEFKKIYKRLNDVYKEDTPNLMFYTESGLIEDRMSFMFYQEHMLNQIEENKLWAEYDQFLEIVHPESQDDFVNLEVIKTKFYHAYKKNIIETLQ